MKSTEMNGMSYLRAGIATAAILGAMMGFSQSADAADEEPMACEAFVTAPYCCYCDDRGSVGSCGVTTDGDGVTMCTRHLCPPEINCYQF